MSTRLSEMTVDQVNALDFTPLLKENPKIIEMGDTFDMGDQTFHRDRLNDVLRKIPEFTAESYPVQERVEDFCATTLEHMASHESMVGPEAINKVIRRAFFAEVNKELALDDPFEKEFDVVLEELRPLELRDFLDQIVQFTSSAVDDDAEFVRREALRDYFFQDFLTNRLWPVIMDLMELDGAADDDWPAEMELLGYKYVPLIQFASKYSPTMSRHGSDRRGDKVYFGNVNKDDEVDGWDMENMCVDSSIILSRGLCMTKQDAMYVDRYATRRLGPWIAFLPSDAIGRLAFNQPAQLLGYLQTAARQFKKVSFQKGLTSENRRAVTAFLNI